MHGGTRQSREVVIPIAPHDPAGGSAPRQEIALAREIRARGLAAGRPPGQIAADIHERCAPVAGTTWIRARRLALGISLADVVAQVRARYASERRAVPGFSETLLSGYESGQKRPGPEYLHYLCAVYHVDPPELGYPGPCFCGGGHRIHPVTAATAPAAATSAPVTAAGRETTPLPGVRPGASAAGPDLPAAQPAASPDPLAAEPTAGPDHDDEVIRRTLLRLSTHPVTGAGGQFFGAADSIRRRMDETLMGGTVTTIVLDEWEDAIASYGTQYLTVPPLRLLCDVLLDFGEVQRMMSRRQPLEFSERLCRLAGQLAGLAGMIMINAGDPRLARSFFRTGRAAADETGDRGLRAWMAAREALVPLYYGDPAEASTLARTAAGLAGRHPCAAAAMAPAVEARALAWVMAQREDPRTGPALRRVTSLLGQAQEQLDRLPAAERSGTAFGYTERQLLFHEGDTRVMLADHRGAEQAFSCSLGHYPAAEVLDRSLIGFGLARCRLAADEPAEALRMSRDTLLAIPPERRSAIMLHAARSVGEAVAARHGQGRAVREYREALPSA